MPRSKNRASGSEPPSPTAATSERDAEIQARLSALETEIVDYALSQPDPSAASVNVHIAGLWVQYWTLRGFGTDVDRVQASRHAREWSHRKSQAQRHEKNDFLKELLRRVDAQKKARKKFERLSKLRRADG